MNLILDLNFKIHSSAMQIITPQQSCEFPDKSLQIVISAENISVPVFNGLLPLYRPCTLTFVINQIAIFEHYDKYLNISLKLNSKYSEFFLLIVQNSYFMAYLARFLLLCLHRPETKNKKTRKITCLT